MFALILSTLLLALAPLVARFIEKRPQIFHFLDGFVLVTIAGLCVFHVLPEILPKVGLWAFLLLAAGALLPYWAEHKIEGLGRAPERTVLVLAFLALLIHATLDGFGLHLPEDRGSLALSIVIHRFPVGLFLWWTIGTNFGRKYAILALLLVALSTIGGYYIGHNVEAWFHGDAIAWIQCILIGSLLHILFHQPAIRCHEPAKVASAAGAVFGVIATYALTVLPDAHGHDHHHENNLELFLNTTRSLFTKSSGPILLGFFGAGILMTFASDRVAKAMKRKSSFGSAMRGVIYGLPLPICSCGVVPLYRSLIAKGAPPSAAIAFLIATPELGFDAVLLSFPLLGANLTIARIIGAFFIALLVGVFVGRTLTVGANSGGHTEECTADHDHDHAHGPDQSEEAKTGSLWQALRYAFADMVDHLGPWIIAGIVAAALLQPLLSPEFLSKIPPSLQIFVIVVLAAPGYVCASAATPIAAILLINGLSPGAVLAFLIAGPATNLTTFGMLKDTHGSGSAIRVILAIVGFSMALGFIANAVIPTATIQPINLDHHHAQSYETAAALIFCGLLFLSIFRTGPRGFLAQLGLSDTHEHQHGAMSNEEMHSHGDSHEPPQNSSD
jgi:uncharacterized protein